MDTVVPPSDFYPEGQLFLAHGIDPPEILANTVGLQTQFGVIYGVQLMAEQASQVQGGDENIEFITDIVAAYVGRNEVSIADIPSVISTVSKALSDLGQTVIEKVAQEPAVPIKQSVKPDYIVCLEDGTKLKTLKRYLRTRFQMTPEEYRQKWGLPKDYPMVAPNYAARRSELAKASGLGQGGRRPAKGAGRGRRTTPQSPSDAASA
jgi:predicted transcriptional regulator